MLRRLLILAAFAAYVAGPARAADPRRDKIIGIIEEELREVTRLSKQREDRDPELLMRVAELHMERARLQREAEHERFLALTAEQRRSADEKAYYAQSNRSFQAANQWAEAVVKRFPQHRDIADVYYVLAFNHRELKDYRSSQHYLTLATQKARKDTPTYHKSQLALAETYYNKQEYAKAIPLYESALSKLNATWWTKDAFNLAWCHYRVKNYDRAIALMKEIHKRSGDNRYINMRYFVERDLGVFFVDARRPDEAIAWYKGQGIDFSSHMLKIAKVYIAQGKFTQAEDMLGVAEQVAKTPDAKAELWLTQLDLFDKYGKVARHYAAASSLVPMGESGKLDGDQAKRLEYHVSKKAAELQKSAASDLYKNVPAERRQRAQRANDYFALLARLKPGKAAEPAFYQAETSYAIGDYAAALSGYMKAHQAAEKEGNSKMRQQAMEGLLAALAQPSLPTAAAAPYYVPVYEAFLKNESNTARAQTVRKKLYKVHMQSNNVEAAEKVLADYAKKHPEDFKSQEAMLAGIMDEYRKKKDYARIKGFVAQINAGTYKVSQKYADALRQMMTKIQIEDAQKSLDKGDKSTALTAYLRIYKNPESTPRAKANAAYNLAALYYEAGDAAQSYSWAVVALQEMDAGEVRQFADSFLAISTNLFLRQRFQQSADLGMRAVAKLCQQGVSSKNTAFKNAAFLWLAEGKIEKAEETLSLGVRCGVDTAPLNEVRLELAKEYSRDKRWESLEAVVNPVLSSPSHAPAALVHLAKLADIHREMGDEAKSTQWDRRFQEIHQSAKARNAEIPVEALDIVAQRLLARLEAKRAPLARPLEFPEQKFNQAVKAKLTLLDSLTGDVQEVQKTGSGRGIVRAYGLLVSAYEDFASELKAFTPEGKSPEYLSSFRKAMEGVWAPILQTAKKRRQEAWKLVREHQILSPDNFGLIAPQGSALVPRYERKTPMVLMDRGGRQ